jgi:hypothetical protein
MHGTPTREDSSRTGSLLRGIRQMPVFHQCVAREAGIGWAMPSRKDGRVYITVPFFGMPTSRGKSGGPLFAPFATMTLDWQKGTLVGYRNLAVDDLWPLDGEPVGTFPHAAVARLRRSEYLQLREELFTLYDDLCRMLAAEATIPPEWSARFSELLRQLMEPSLTSYYRVLAPNFMDRFLGEEHSLN